MKKVILIFSLLTLTFFISSQSFAQILWTGNANIYFGIKTIDSDDWSLSSAAINLDDEIGAAEASVDKATEFGINADFGPITWPVTIAVGFLQGSGDDSFSRSAGFTLSDGSEGTVSGNAKLEVTTQELRLGAKKAWEIIPNVSPYVAGGAAMIKAKGKISAGYGTAIPDAGVSSSESWSDSDSDSAIGWWLSGGAYYTFIGHLNGGIEVGYSQGVITLGDTNFEAGGIHYGIFLGYHF